MSPWLTAAIIVLIIAALIAAMLAAPIGIRVVYDGQLKVAFSVFSFTIHPPKKKKKPPKKEPKKTAPKGNLKSKFSAMPLTDKLAIIKTVVTKFVRKMYFDKLKLHITAACSDSAKTALLYGRLCALIYPPVAMLKHYGRVKNDDVRLSSDFNRQSTAADADISVRIRVIDALAALIAALKMIV